MDILMLTCERDKELAKVSAEGLKKFWPGCRPMLFMDTDTATEAKLPDDIREMVRRMPYLRRYFDLPRFASTEPFAILDSDCLCYQNPAELNGLAFQGNPGGGDRINGLRVWKELGFEIPNQDVRFCCGMFTATMEMFEQRDLAFEYLRLCRKYGFDRDCAYPAVVCEQGMISGMWRLKYPHNPLPPHRYPWETYVPGCAIWHTSSVRTPEADALVEEYAKMVGA